MMAAQATGDPGRAVASVLGMMAAVVAGCALAAMVPLGFKTGIIIGAVIAVVKCLWPRQIDIDALILYEPDD